jgi:predicted MFS family arabinose efflux permease
MDQTATSGRKLYSLVLLTLVTTISIMDRTIAGILQEPIKHEFHLSDSALGLLSGLVFAIPYAATSIPFGLVADRVERSRLVAACLAFWSVMTALCGLSATFGQLLLARIAVAMGEAAGGPATTSMIADLFSQRRRSTALGFHYLSLPLGTTLAIAVGGALGGLYGWRTAFLAVGGPGLALSLIILLTMRAPPRGGSAATAAPPPPFRETLAYIRSQRSLVHLIAGFVIGQLVTAAIGVWTTSFFVRYHHMQVHEVAKVLAPLSGLTGVVGVFSGGLFADYAARKDPARAFWVIIGSLVLVTPAALTVLFMPEAGPAFAAYGVYLLISFVWMGGASAITQNLAGPSRRATVAAVVLTLSSLLGSGMGPQLTGLISDLLKPYAGAESLRWSMAGLGVLSLWAAAHMFAARRTYLQDLARANAPS